MGRTLVQSGRNIFPVERISCLYIFLVFWLLMDGWCLMRHFWNPSSLCRLLKHEKTLVNTFVIFANAFGVKSTAVCDGKIHKFLFLEYWKSSEINQKSLTITGSCSCCIIDDKKKLHVHVFWIILITNAFSIIEWWN